MSADPTANLQLFSPPGSGRSSPAPRASRNATEESLLKKDKSFRRYATGVERALALWDTAQQEWADYISFLGRLLKALQSHPSDVPIIPHSDTVALRLAQCLNPTLPSGVHQKALEVYDYIFATIGKVALARDLSIYFPGLASVLSFASLSVRPLFLSVFEAHILKVDGQALRPALKAIILSLLPGLEDETSEDFERMVSAVDKLRVVIEGHEDGRSVSGSSHFWQCFFLATITNASRRQGALAYLVRRLPKFAVSKDRGQIGATNGSSNNGLSLEAEAATSPEPGLLIRCFESGLLDQQLLLQRGFLDLLVSHLPLDSPVLQERVDKVDLERLVAAAAGVVSRRDMSLNRRLWAWFLGPEPTSSDSTVTSPTHDRDQATDPATQHAQFFSKYGLEALTSSVLKLIHRRSNAPAERSRPYRICLSLMDRWEVGGLIVPEIFLPALQSVQAYGETASREQFEEVLRSASAFFDGVDGGLIWGKILHLVKSALDPNRSEDAEALEKMRLAKFILARFNLREEDMLLHHMPLFILGTLVALNKSFRNSVVTSTHLELFNMALEIVDSLTQIMPERSVRPETITKDQILAAKATSKDLVAQQISRFYGDSQGNLDAADPPFTARELGQKSLREAVQLMASALEDGQQSRSVDVSARILSNLVLKVKCLDALDDSNMFELFQRTLQRPSIPFSALAAMVLVLSALETTSPGSPYIPLSRLPELLQPLIAGLWQFLSPHDPKFHVEATRCLLQLHVIMPTSRMVEGAISTIVVEDAARTSANESVRCVRHFAVLWTHVMHELNAQSDKRNAAPRRVSSQALVKPILAAGDYHAVLTRPLLLFLDKLTEDSSDTAAFMRSWLQDLPSLNRVFDIVAHHIQTLPSLTIDGQIMEKHDRADIASEPPRSDDSKECLYFLKHVFNILRKPSPSTWKTLAETPAPHVPDADVPVTYQEWLVRTCLSISTVSSAPKDKSERSTSDRNSTPIHVIELQHLSVSIIAQVYQSPFSMPLRDLEFEIPLMARLQTAGPSLQNVLLGAILSALRLRQAGPRAEAADQRPPTNNAHRSRLSLAMNRDSTEYQPALIVPPPQLIETLQFGFSSELSRPVLDDWVQFLIEVLPMYSETIFQNLLPLVECFCKQINACFQDLKYTFAAGVGRQMSPESALISLVNGLEQILAKAHDRLTTQETKAAANKTPEQPQGFFSNVVSGVFTSETAQTRTPTANSRLTVLLCFQDTVRISFSIWSWATYSPDQAQPDPPSAASYGYTSQRMRNRARRLMEHLFAAEALECLETLIVLWAKAKTDDGQAAVIMGLLNVLNGSKPKYTIPAIFNAVYSRTDPNALDPNRTSTLTSDLTESELIAFLVDYIRSLEDDAMDEIWSDCALFLRDVLANPLPHRQILPTLLEFTAVIGRKVDNTNFGEQRKMRRELADIFSRILTAISTTRSMGYKQDGQQSHDTKITSTTNGARAQQRATDVVAILTSIVQHLPIILIDNDRVTKVVSDLSTSIIAPTFKAKAFPENITVNLLNLVQGLANVAQNNKLLKKEIYDAFNDPKFFNTPLALLRDSWLPILAQWTQTDRERVPELLARITAPTTAGIMFGVGATSARQEADRKTQTNLRRIVLLLLASPEDAYTPVLPQILDKAVELLTATPATSPSSTTRADVLLVLRAITLKTSSISLAPLWPVANGELTASLSSLLPDAKNKDNYNNAGIVQTCKLLDELVVLAPDDFQLSEWLFICDTVDAVYKPDTAPLQLSLTDEINEVLSQASAMPPPIHIDSSGAELEKRTLMIDPLIEALEKEEHAPVLDMTRSELINRVVRPFLGSLGLNAFEARYRGGEGDWDGVWRSCVADAVEGSK